MDGGRPARVFRGTDHALAHLAPLCSQVHPEAAEGTHRSYGNWLGSGTRPESEYRTIAAGGGGSQAKRAMGIDGVNGNRGGNVPRGAFCTGSELEEANGEK